MKVSFTSKIRDNLCMENINETDIPARGLQRSRGLARILNRETAVSDMLQFLTELDPKPWAKTPLDFVPVSIERETRISAESAQGSADLVLQSASGQTAAIEVKLNHSLSDEQVCLYDSWSLQADAKIFLASLDPHSELPRQGWVPLYLDELFDHWGKSDVVLARELSIQIQEILQHRRNIVDSLFMDVASLEEAKCFADIGNVDVMKMVVRRLRQELSADFDSVSATVTLGGGNSIIQTWNRVPSTNLFFIVEARFASNRAVLRFGLEGGLDTDSGLEVWRAAQSIESDLRADRLAEFAANSGMAVFEDAFIAKGPGRPKHKGSWEDALFKWQTGGSFSEHFGGLNPGFWRDRAYRLQALGEIKLTNANGLTLSNMIRGTHQYLQNIWAHREKN